MVTVHVHGRSVMLLPDAVHVWDVCVKNANRESSNQPGRGQGTPMTSASKAGIPGPRHAK